MPAKKASKPTKKKATVVKKKTIKKTSEKASNLPAKTQPANAQVVRKALADLAKRKKAAGCASWSDQLFEIYEIMLGLCNSISANQSIAAYSLGGLLIQALSLPKTYGTEAAKKLADKLGIPEDRLRDCGHIARAWMPGEFLALFKLVNAKGRRLSYSHFVEIAQRDAKSERDALIARVRDECLTVLELKAAIRALKAPALPPVEPQVDKSVLGIRKEIDRAACNVEMIPMLSQRWQDRVTKPLEDEPEKLDSDVARDLRDKQGANLKTIKTLQDENKKIDKLFKAAGLPTYAEVVKANKEAEEAEKADKKAPKPAGQSRLAKAAKAAGKTHPELLEGLKTKGGN